MQCLFCQNHDISRRDVSPSHIYYRSVETVVARIQEVLPETENMVGFVSASHYAHLVPNIVEQLHRQGLHPTIVWNSNGYETVATLRSIAPYVDVYLPDFKYMDAGLAARYSGTADYIPHAQQALIEMQSQVGPVLHCDEQGLAFRGMLVRHLVLPGQIDNTRQCLQWIAEHLGTRTALSLMAQYFPPQTETPWPDQLGRPLQQQEYDQALEYCRQLGFENVWTQELQAQHCYRPQFSKQDAFADNDTSL